MAAASFVPRGPAEADESLRQVIPYVVLRRGGAAFTYARSRRGNEARLHDLRSLGVGGHVNPADLPDGLVRLAADPRPALAADAEPVSRVHLGVVFAAEVGAGDVRLSDEGRLVDGRFVPVAELAADGAAYEGWSRLLIGHLVGRA